MNEWQWTPEQQAIIDRIQSGQSDFTFGPGSPNPTHEDLHTYVGGKFSPAGGFAVEGGVALAPKEYNMFSPEQRKALGIMDIAPRDQVGKIERYYGRPGDGMSSPQFAANSIPMPVSSGTYASSQPSGYAYGTGSNAGQMSTMADYGNAVSRGTSVANAGASIGNALAQTGQAMARAQQTGNAQALAMLSQRRNALSQYLQLPPISGYYG